MAAIVVWCNECKTAVWAYDHMPDDQDIRGLMNMMGMPCPKCGSISNFDGWSGYEHDFTLPDGWSLLKHIFELNVKDGLWAISPDCTWFRRPDEEMQSDEFPADLTDEISELIKERSRSNLAIQAVESEMRRVHDRREGQQG